MPMPLRSEVKGFVVFRLIRGGEGRALSGGENWLPSDSGLDLLDIGLLDVLKTS